MGTQNAEYYHNRLSYTLVQDMLKYKRADEFLFAFYAIHMSSGISQYHHSRVASKHAVPEKALNRILLHIKENGIGKTCAHGFRKATRKLNSAFKGHRNK